MAGTSERLVKPREAVASWFAMFGLHDPDHADGSFAWKADPDSQSTVAESVYCQTCGVKLLDVTDFERDGAIVTFNLIDSLLRLHYVLAFEVEARSGE